VHSRVTSSWAMVELVKGESATPAPARRKP